MNEMRQHYDVVIIGAGYSGTMVAVHLMRARRHLRVALVDRAPSPGRGVAYGTGDARHLLNVRADQMGAFPDDVGHFYRWLQAHPGNLAAAGVAGLNPGAFVPRLVFGDYIQDLLREARELPGTLDVIQDEVIDLQRNGAGPFELATKGGRQLAAPRVVLALGNFPPGEARHAQAWFMNDPYAPETHQRLAEPGDILIIGTGLTSLDMLMTLDKRKPTGTIHLLSRRGLFPQPHKKADPYPLFLDPENLPKTTRELFRRVRQEVRRAAEQGIDWRPVLDSLRPLHQAIWTGLDLTQQRRFLRHVQGLWDTHRHRCAPEIMAVKERLEKEGRLVCHQGRIQAQTPEADGVDIAYQPRGGGAVRKFRVRRVLSCTGPQSDYRKLNDPLVKQLFAHNLLATDPLHMGAQTADGGQVCDQAGQPIPNLYTLGSIQKGRLYESIAVPELRDQAAGVAARLLADQAPGQAPVNPPARPDGGFRKDPRVYMAAERTFLAWVRTGLAFMGFGFVVARFGFLLREMGLEPAPAAASPPGFSTIGGAALIIAGIALNLYALIRHGRYVRALDEDRFRPAYSANFTFVIVSFLAVVGLLAAFHVKPG